MRKHEGTIGGEALLFLTTVGIKSRSIMNLRETIASSSIHLAPPLRNEEWGSVPGTADNQPTGDATRAELPGHSLERV